MRNVLLKIYPELNLGDDLFLKIILERYKDSSFYVLANKATYKNFEKLFPNLKVIDRLENVNYLDRILLKVSKKFPINIQKYLFKKYLKKQHSSILHNMDLFVTIGGSMFIENDKQNYQTNVEYYRFINENLIKIPKFYLGCNFGPYNTQNFINDFREIFDKAKDLSFREKSSKQILDLSNIRVNPDIVFGLSKQSPKKIVDSVGLVLVDPRVKMPNDNINYSDYIQTLSILITELQNKGKKVYLFSFCKTENDENLINDIQATGLNNLNKAFYTGNIEEFLEIYSTMETMYCGRFHSMILSMLYNQKILPIIYSKKMTNILGDVNFKGECVNLVDLDVKEVFKYINLTATNQYNINDVIEKSKEHFNVLDNFLIKK